MMAISALRKGRQSTLCWNVLAVLFQSTPLRKGRPATSGSGKSYLMFQSTPLRKGRLFIYKSFNFFLYLLGLREQCLNFCILPEFSKSSLVITIDFNRLLIPRTVRDILVSFKFAESLKN